MGNNYFAALGWRRNPNYNGSTLSLAQNPFEHCSARIFYYVFWE